jgi:SNARE associated Golgi protein
MRVFEPRQPARRQAAALYAGTTHHLSIVGLAAAAAIIGDNVGFWIGRTGGLRLAERYGRYVRLDRAKLKVGRYLFARHGVKVVFFGRFVAVLRTFAAFFAGVGKMSWPGFLLANAAGGLLWASFYAFGAYALGSAASFIVVRRSLRRLGQRAEDAFPEEQAASQPTSGALVASSATPASGRSASEASLQPTAHGRKVIAAIHEANAAGRAGDIRPRRMKKNAIRLRRRPRATA